jgi:hypothetical protein
LKLKECDQVCFRKLSAGDQVYLISYKSTLKVAALWMLLGILVYFLYSRHHSLVRKEAAGKK